MTTHTSSLHTQKELRYSDRQSIIGIYHISLRTRDKVLSIHEGKESV